MTLPWEADIFYTKEGGKQRAEMGFFLTFPNDVRIIETADGRVEVEFIENYQVVMRYWAKLKWFLR